MGSFRVKADGIKSLGESWRRGQKRAKSITNAANTEGVVEN